MGVWQDPKTQFKPGNPGRKAGTPRVGKRRAAKLAKLGAEAAAAAALLPQFEGDATQFLQRLYRDESLPLETRIKAASLCQSFEHPTLSAVAVKDVTPRDPAAVEKRIEELLKIGMSNAPKLLEG